MLTGETGAGKSLLIDALGLALGARADTTLVRHGADVARVEALFDRAAGAPDRVREVGAGGPLDGAPRRRDRHGRAGSPRPSAPLVEIHGQHDQQRLLDERWQRDLLDAYGGHAALRGRGRERRRALAGEPRGAGRAGDSIRASSPAGSSSLEHEADEIAAAGLRPGEADEIRARLAAAQHGETIAPGPPTIREALVGEGTRRAGAGWRGRRAGARRWPASIARFEALADRLAGLEAELEDVAAEVARRWPRASTTTRRGSRGSRSGWRRSTGCERRYGDDEAAVHRARRARSAAEAERLRGLEDERARRAADDARLLLEVADAAAALSIRRARRAPSGSRRAVGGGPGRARVPGRRVRGRARPPTGRRATSRRSRSTATPSRSTPAGSTSVVFRFAPNPGEPARPLARIASGGELSRVALAIKEVLAEADDHPDARVRRDRRRASAAGARIRSGAACGRWHATTRSCA